MCRSQTPRLDFGKSSYWRKLLCWVGRGVPPSRRRCIDDRVRLGETPRPTVRLWRKRLRLGAWSFFGVWILVLGAFLSSLTCSALELSLPTPNDALFRPGGEPAFFQGTANHDWRSGTYGCVRSEGRQFHEGIDVRCLTRNRRGEPTDPVFAIADGKVAYLANVAGQSNYGRYALVRHEWDGVEVFSLYAHVASFTPGLRVGQRVTRGQPIATLGHSGTQNIPKDRAHLHFEICFQLNRNFARWFAPKLAKGDRNDHGNFNGLNFIGIDPTPIFRAAKESGANLRLANPSSSQAGGLRHFNFRAHLESQPIAFTVVFPARRAPLSWMRAHPWCIVAGPNPAPQRNVGGASAPRPSVSNTAGGRGTEAPPTFSGAAPLPTAYEVSFTAVGVPTLVRPCNDRITAAPALLSVDEKALAPYRYRGLLTLDPKRRVWRLTERGGELMELLGY